MSSTSVPRGPAPAPSAPPADRGTAAPSPSSAAAPSPSAPSLRAAVVGAGVGGLTFALALPQLLPGSHVTVYEKTTEDVWKAAADAREPAGANLGLTGGAAVLRSLGFGAALDEIGHPIRRFLVRTVRPRGRAATLMDVPIGDMPGLGSVTSPSKGGGGAAVMVLRSELVARLAAALDPRRTRLALGSAVATAADGRVVFADGSTEGPFDVIVASDGIRSALRASGVVAAPTPPRFSGIRATFAVAAAPLDPLTPPAPPRRPVGVFHGWAAPHAYALTMTAHSTDVLVHLTREKSPPTFGENPEWDAAARKAAAGGALKSKMAHFPAESLSILDSAVNDPTGRVFELGIFERESLPPESWAGCSFASSSAAAAPHPCDVALLGDAAHAMTPFLGQGANSAIQDAYCLAAKLRDAAAASNAPSAPSFHNTSDMPALSPAQVEGAIKSYAAVRSGPTSLLQRGSALMGRLSTLYGPLAPLRNAVLWLLGVTGAWRRVFAAAAVPRVS